MLSAMFVAHPLALFFVWVTGWPALQIPLGTIFLMCCFAVFISGPTDDDLLSAEVRRHYGMDKEADAELLNGWHWWNRWINPPSGRLAEEVEAALSRRLSQ